MIWRTRGFLPTTVTGDLACRLRGNHYTRLFPGFFSLVFGISSERTKDSRVFILWSKQRRDPEKKTDKADHGILSLIRMVSDSSKRNVLMASAFGSSLAPFMVSSMIVALPTIGHEFSGNPELLGWLTSIFFIAAAIFLVPFGRIGDRYGVKKIFTLGMAVYFFSAILCIVAPDIRFLIAARFVTGIGAAMIFGTSIALLSLVFPESGRGKAIGINVTAMSAGFLLGFFLGGFLIFYAGWRSIFLITLPVELFVIGLILSRIRGECELSVRKELDIPGMLLYCLVIAFMMVGFSILPGINGIVLIAAGLICLVLLFFRETKTQVPFLDITIFWKNRIFTATNITVLLFNTSNFAVIFLLSLYLQDIRNLDARITGIILLTPVIFMALLSTLREHFPTGNHPG